METPKTLTLNQAAKLTGKSKGTLSKSLKNGTLSFISKDKTGYSIDPSELNRVFPVNMLKMNTSYQSEPPVEHHENTLKMRELELILKAEQHEKEIYRSQLREKDTTIEDYRIRLTKAEDVISRQTLLLADMRPEKPVEKRKGILAGLLRKNT